MSKKDALVGNAADPEQVRKAASKEDRKRHDELNDLRVVLNSKEGRRFLFRLVNELCHYDTNDFNNSGSLTYFNLGERNIGRVVKSDAIEASLEAFQLMEKENWSYLTEEYINVRRK